MATECVFKRRWRGLLIAALLALVGVLLAGSAPYTVHAQIFDADVEAILWLSPADDPGGNVVEPGELLDLDVRVENVGSGDAFDVQVAVPYERDRFLLVEHDNVQVSEEELTVSFDLVPPGEFEVRSLLLRVRNDVPVPEVLSIAGDTTWEDTRNGGDGITNRVNILIDYVADGNDEDDEAERVVDIDDDVTPPSTCVLAVARDGRGYWVQWGGSDNQSGIHDYDVQVMQLPNGRWRDWQVSTTDTDGWFGPTGNAHFGFRVRATDRRGNEEAWPLQPQLSTTQADIVMDRCPGTERVEPI
jgi:hypothetical protein